MVEGSRFTTLWNKKATITRPNTTIDLPIVSDPLWLGFVKVHNPGFPFITYQEFLFKQEQDHKRIED